jgi:3-oxoadipate enol-lactonase
LEPRAIEVDVGGVRLHARASGAGNHPWLVFLHSLACHGAMWAAQVTAFAERFRVLVVDVRGHGASDAPEGPYTMDILADDLAGVLASQRIDRFHLVGLSMGGMIGQAFALRHPGRLDSLMLAGTASRWPASAAALWAERVATAARDGMEPLVEPALGRWLTATFRSRRPEVVDAVATMMRSTPVAGYVGCSHAIARIDFTDRLAAIDCPVHIVVGSEDQGTPPALSRDIHRAIPGSTLDEIAAAAHLVNLEQPETFNRSLSAFLDRAGSRTG